MCVHEDECVCVHVVSICVVPCNSKKIYTLFVSKYNHFKFYLKSHYPKLNQVYRENNDIYNIK